MVKISVRKLTYLVILIISLTALTVFMAGCTPEEYEAEVQADPEDAGEIKGEGTYEEGEQVTIEVEPKEGYEFRKWQKDGEEISTDEHYQFEINDDKDIQAKFTKKEYQVKLKVNDKQMGSVSGSLAVPHENGEGNLVGSGEKEITAGETNTYEHGDKIFVVAEPERSSDLYQYEFNNWTINDEEVSKDKTYVFEIKEDKTLQANFEKRASKDDFDPEQIDYGVIDIGLIIDEKFGKRGPPMNQVTHLKINDQLQKLEEMITVDELEAKWYYDGKKLISVEEVYQALENDWNSVIAEDILDSRNIKFNDNPPEEPTPQYFNGIGYMELSPTGQKIAFDLDNHGAQIVFIGAFGIIDLKDKKVYFTNINHGDLAEDKCWAPNEKYIAYISKSGGQSGSPTEWIHIDNIETKENVATLDSEKYTSVLEKEGFDDLLSYGRDLHYETINLSWSDDGNTFKFSTVFKTRKNGDISKLSEIEWLFDVETEEFKIESVVKN